MVAPMVQAEDGYLSRFKEFRLVENKRESLIEVRTHFRHVVTVLFNFIHLFNCF